MFKDVNEAIYWIEHIKRVNKRTSLDRMRRCLKLLGNPEDYYKKIHVAGTNGKGSTVSYIKNILQQQGLKVGANISPYVICFNERIQVNNEYISDDNLVKYTNRIKVICDFIWKEDEDIVTFFEVITLISLLYFKECAVDYAVIEVGMGGLLDATNVINADVCLITNIGYDHMKTLGSTLEEIALNKLGIVKEHNHLITTVSKDLHVQFEAFCSEKKASVKFIKTDDIDITLSNKTQFIYEGNNYSTPLIGIHQAFNAILAIEAVKYLISDISYDVILKGLGATSWPGRMELVAKYPTIYLDGAHNIDGVLALIKTINVLTTKKIKLVFCALGDKETQKMIEILEPLCEEIIFTTIDDPRVKDPQLLLQEATIENKRVMKSLEEVILYLKTSKCEINIITGSLHFISFVRPYFLNK